MATQDIPPLTNEALAEMLRYYHLDSLEFRAASELRQLRAAVEDAAYAVKTGVLPASRGGPNPYHMTKDEVIDYVGWRLKKTQG